jgi:predicted CXXCH cytochrome family protein
MEPYDIPTDQGQEYRRSIHWETMSEGGDTSAPTCNDCHGNHGAAPPGVSWVGNVCGQCHVVMAEYFQESHHSQTFTAIGVPGCAFCHQNHEILAASDELLGMGEGAVCRSCHSEQDTGGLAAAGMRAMIDSLRFEIDSAASVLETAENSGMEVSASIAALNDAQSALVKARAAMHSFDPELVAAEVEPGTEVSASALARGEKALRDLQIRRIGLAVSVLIIAGLIVGLILKIKQMEQPA